MRVTSGGDADIEYQGVVSGDQPFSSAPVPFRLEGGDLLSFSNDPEPLIEYSLYVNGSGRDGFTFAFQAAPIAGEACFDVAVPEDIVVYLGSGKSPVGPRVVWPHLVTVTFRCSLAVSLSSNPVTKLGYFCGVTARTIAGRCA